MLLDAGVFCFSRKPQMCIHVKEFQSFSYKKHSLSLSVAELSLSMISRVGDFCVLRFYLCIYRYGSSLSVYSTLRRTLAAVS